MNLRSMRPWKEERGSGLVIALLATTVFVIMAGTLYELARTQVRESVYQTRRLQAHYIAEAGMEDALLQIREDPDTTPKIENKPFAGGYYTVFVSTTDPVMITSTGYSAPIALLGPVIQTVRAKLSIELLSPPPPPPGQPPPPRISLHTTWDPGSWSVSAKRLK